MEPTGASVEHRQGVAHHDQVGPAMVNLTDGVLVSGRSTLADLHGCLALARARSDGRRPTACATAGRP